MRWMDPPDSILRFTLHQRIQHWGATALGAILALTAAGSVLRGGPPWNVLHQYAGFAGLAFLGYHAAYLALVGIRHDVPADRVAFLPLGWERKALRKGGGKDDPTGKYAPEEKGDYLAILILSLAVAGAGAVLCWPGRFSVPGREAYGWVRTVHAALGAAWVLHVLATHVDARWVSSPREFRGAILYGKVPLAAAEARPGWVEELVARKVLMPAPQEAIPEETVQSLQVRDLLEEGNRLAREGRYGEASVAFEEALRLFPDYSQARFNLAVSRMKEGRNDLAAEQFRRFLANDPFNPMSSRAKELLDSISRGNGEEGKPG